MDQEKLKKKKQLNVQEQNTLEKNNIRECALAFRMGNPRVAWVRHALSAATLNPDDGILLSATTVPCGGYEETAYAEWLAKDRQFYTIEATTSLGESTLISLDLVKNVTESTDVSRHVRGKGMSFGCLAIEVLKELKGHIDK